MSDDKNAVKFSAKVSVEEGGSVAGSITARMFSHVKAEDESSTHLSFSEPMTEEELAELGEAITAIINRHRGRLEDRVFDERSFARAHARTAGEIKE